MAKIIDIPKGYRVSTQGVKDEDRPKFRRLTVIEESLNTLAGCKDWDHVEEILVRLTRAEQTSVFEKGLAAELLRKNEHWRGKANTWAEYANTRELFGVGYNQINKYIRLYIFYIERMGLSIEEVSYPLDNLVMLMPRVKEQGWEACKGMAAMQPVEIKKLLAEESNKPVLSDRQVSGLVRSMKMLMDPALSSYLNHILKLTKLSFPIKQIKCNSCGTLVRLDRHHKKLRSQGGDDSDENLEWLCRKCHNKKHGIGKGAK